MGSMFPLRRAAPRPGPSGAGMRTRSAAGILVLAGAAPSGRAAERLTALAAAGARPLIYAADGGAAHLSRWGLNPDLIVGDNDSLPGGLFPGVERRIFPKQKDFTDGAAALRLLGQAVAGPLAMFGALGGRPDHLLGNISMPLRELDDPARLTVYEDDCELHYSRGYAELHGAPGDTLSLIPLTAAAKLSLSGLAYPLRDYDAEPGDTRLISNQFSGHTAIIEHQGGLLLIIHIRSRY